MKYKKQRKWVVKLKKNCKKKFFDNLETKTTQNGFEIKTGRTFLIITLKAIDC